MFVVPTATVVTTPVLLTVAFVMSDEAQEYVKGAVPVAFDAKVKVLPIQTAFPPVIVPAAGNGLTVTVTTFELAAEHEPLVTTAR